MEMTTFLVVIGWVLFLTILLKMAYGFFRRLKRRYWELHAMSTDIQSKLQQLQNIQEHLKELDVKIMQMNQHLVLEHLYQVLETSKKDGYIDEGQRIMMIKALDTMKLDNLRGEFE